MKLNYNILLLGAGGNAGINFTKSIKLASPGTKIIGVDLDRYNIISSNCDKKILLKFNSIDDKINKLNLIIKKYNIDFIHAQPDAEVKFLCMYSQKLNSICFQHNIDTWNILHDKLYCQKIWNEKLNLSFKSYSLREVINNPSLFNEVSKGQKVWFRSIKGAGSKASLPISTLEEALSWSNYWINNKNSDLSDFMICEYLTGTEYAVQSLWNNGELVHMQARERVEYFFGSIMPSGQSSTPSVARTVSDDHVYDIAKHVVSSIDSNPNGIYCIDMKTNSKGVIVPTEINYGRFFTTSDFLANAGVNTPWTYINLALTGIVDKYKINTIKETKYWLRGLDKEPTMITEKELNKEI